MIKPVNEPVSADTWTRLSAENWTWSSWWFLSFPGETGAPCSWCVHISPTWDRTRLEDIIPQPDLNQSPICPTHQPLLTLMDKTWLLRPSWNRLGISVSTVISRPSRHSRPNREMEGTEKICEHTDGCQCPEPQEYLTPPGISSPWELVSGTGWRRWTGSPYWLGWGSPLQTGHRGSQRSWCCRREPSCNTEELFWRTTQNNIQNRRSEEPLKNQHQSWEGLQTTRRKNVEMFTRKGAGLGQFYTDRSIQISSGGSRNVLDQF